ncbi:MAG: peptidoglycan DD-metalloendopeptidase family protein [Oscillospiraceae bacterium]|jgi:murein DD-endopeptidase MepM/ murein hydrolase activator NlpD|nr:peptidoglycan DD-metalloendopeptidase family protein [Oscillospiraceae bacterium]
MPKARKQAAEQAKQPAESAKNTAEKLGGKAKDAQKTAHDAKQAVQGAKQTLQQTRQAGRQTVQTAKQAVITGQQAEKTIKTSAKTAKSTAKGTIKTVKKSVKTAERTAKTTVKTAKQTANVAQKSAQVSAKAAKLAAQTSRAAAKSAKATVKATIATVKTVVEGAKAVVSAIIAGGWVAVVIIVVVCLIGLLVGSIFGIFFSGEDSKTGRSMPSVVQELTTEFYGKVDEIKSKTAHDVMDIRAMSIRWNEVLAVYAVKVNGDPKNPAEVATLDDGKVAKLRDILNDMTTLKFELKTETQEQFVTDDDGNETTESVTVIRLIISLEQKSEDEMAGKYGFDKAQKDNLHEFLSPEYASLWAQLLGGYAGGSGEIVKTKSRYKPTDIFAFPLEFDYNITSPFGYRKDPFDGTTKFHGGVDIAAPENTPILAAADGTVIAANSTDSWGSGWGYFVKLQHNSTYSTFLIDLSTNVGVLIYQIENEATVIKTSYAMATLAVNAIAIFPLVSTPPKHHKHILPQILRCSQVRSV